MVKGLLIAAGCTLGASPLLAQDIVRGDAAAGLVSHLSKGEVHVIADPALNDRRLVLKIVVLNLSGVPQPFGPDAVTVAAGDARIALISREALIAEQTGSGIASDETSQAHAAAALPTNAAGQRDVTSFNGSMGGGIAGVPTSSIDRSQRRSNTAAAAALDAVLLKPMTIRPNGADGGQMMTEKLKRSKTPELVVTVSFAGEVHKFAVKTPH
jgi:hypothetical protein